MDAQGRGRAGDIDPADQWVFNPDTGSYELRLDPVEDGAAGAHGSSPTAPRQRRASSTRRDGATQRDAAAQRGNPASRERTRDTGNGPEDQGQVPPQRGRRRSEGNSTPGHRSAGHTRRKPKAGLSRKQKALRWGGGTLGLILIAGCTGGYLLYQHFNNNINTVDVGKHNPATTDGPVNILIIGTDTRAGEGNEGYGDTGSVGHADTTLLFHVSKDRSNATVLSIPRDLMTDIPSCTVKQEDGSEKTIPGTRNARFNTSLGQRGRDPGCTWQTAEKITGVEINHFMMADFNAVKDLSTAVGGVEVCLAKDIDDPKSQLKLSAGKHVVKGEQALSFVRTRKSVGNRSDLDRIKLQQQFLSSMIRKMKSGGTLSDPGKLWDLSEVATKSLTVDTGIGSVKKLISLAKDLRRVDVSKVTFATVPVLDNPEDPATVVLNEAKAAPLFKMVQQDKSLTKAKKEKKKKEQKEKVKPAPAAEVRVDVLNGGGPVGAAQGTVTWLQNSEGVPLSTNAGNAEEDVPETQLEYGPDQADQAAALAEMMGLPDSALKESSTDSGPGEPMTLTLGEDYTEVGAPIAAPDKAPEGVQRVNADDKSICAK